MPPRSPKKYNVNIPPETLESCFPPSVQSGAQLDFSTFAAPGKGSLSPDVIYCSMGVAHNSYCATVARTFFIDATEEMGDLYTVLHAAHTAAVDKIVHGTSASVVYKAALAAIEEKRSDLVPYFGKNVGHSIGVDLREPFALSAKNAGELRCVSSPPAYLVASLPLQLTQTGGPSLAAGAARAWW